MMDREKVIKALEDALVDKKNQGDYSVRFSFEVVEIIITLLKEQEAIVRCADCRHADISPSGLIKCRGIFRSREWYCADGERK